MRIKTLNSIYQLVPRQEEAYPWMLLSSNPKYAGPWRVKIPNKIEVGKGMVVIPHHEDYTHVFRTSKIVSIEA